MYTKGSVFVMELPEQLMHQEAKTVLGELEVLLKTDRPHIVLDCAKVRHIDSAGVDMLLHCLDEAMKRDGDLKLAAVSPSSAVVLELMRVDRLFEVFETSDEAARSFHVFGSGGAQHRPWNVAGYQPDLKAVN